MDTYLQISSLAFKPEIWLILGILLVMADIFLGYDFFVLPVGAAALIVSAVVYAQKNRWFGEETVLLDDWHEVGFFFAILSVISVILIRFIWQKNKKEQADINDY
ncbi:NfeD family protein [Curvivirga sp.]|uniref:NfeD family protein n=1 Tax=Curvivirga sp. TaxID=2856848 RepID=UPI003B59EC7E